MLKIILFIPFALFLFNSLFFITGDSKKKQKILDPPFLNISSAWADSVMSAMTVDERIAQMFMIAAYSNKDRQHLESIAEIIKKHKIGGLIMMQGGPVRHINAVNYFQSVSKIPLLISMDAEWGVSMRLDSVIELPRQMSLGAISDNKLIYDYGEEIAFQCKRLGIHINFAPVADVNNNPANPVINSRSFGENKHKVTAKSMQYMYALQNNKILAVAKHFPGHGDTDTDSHYALPLLNHSRKRLDTLELFPFSSLINAGLGGAMVAHLNVPAYDTTKNTATTLSPNVVKKILSDSLKFKGLIFTDALNMKGVSNYFKPGELALMSALAGNDVLLFAEDVPEGIRLIKEAIQNGLIKQSEIDNRCRKILLTKFWAGLNKKQQIPVENVYADLNSIKATLLKRKIIEQSSILVKNSKGLVPFYRLDTLKISIIDFSEKKSELFVNTLKLYADVTPLYCGMPAEIANFQAVSDSVRKSNLVIVNLRAGNNSASKNYGISDAAIELINKLAETKSLVLNLLGNPYILKKINCDKIKSVLVTNDFSSLAEEISAQMLFGGITVKGRLPVTVSDKIKEGSGITLALKIRFKYTSPEELKVNTNILAKADSLVLNAIAEGAFPGCQVLVAKGGVVFYNKAFGYHTFDSTRKVSIFDIYDLASITKVAATTTALMKLYDDKLFDPEKLVSSYISELDSTDKNDITLIEVLTHNARLTPYLMFWAKTLKKGRKWNDEIYSTTFSEKFPVKVANDMYITKSYADTMMQQIAKSKLQKKKEYKYSDLGMYWLKQIIEAQSKKTIDKYLQDEFYASLGAYTLGYNPLDRYKLENIIPTENDTVFRKQLIHGYVHDQGAAMTGGIAGHAGLFSNANDLAKLFQMILDKGTYGGKQYLGKNTVDYFNTAHLASKGNRRGLGFDKPEPNKRKDSPVHKCVSLKAFGHQGFTGTVAWADPANDLLFVFLSNRIYPDAENKKINKLGVRAKLHALFYDALK